VPVAVRGKKVTDGSCTIQTQRKVTFKISKGKRKKPSGGVGEKIRLTKGEVEGETLA